MNQYGGESHVRYDSIPVDHIGDLDVTGWRLCGPCVNLSIDGRVNVGFDMSPANARALAAQLIAAADYAEGK